MVSEHIKIFFENTKNNSLFEDLKLINDIYYDLTPDTIYKIFKLYGVNLIMYLNGKVEDIELCVYKIHNYFYNKNVNKYSKLKNWHILLIIHHMLKFNIFLSQSNRNIIILYNDLLTDDYDTKIKYDKWVREYNMFLSQLEFTVSQINYTNKTIDIYINNVNSNCNNYITDLENDIMNIMEKYDTKFNRQNNMIWILFIMLVFVIINNVFRKN